MIEAGTPIAPVFVLGGGLTVGLAGAALAHLVDDDVVAIEEVRGLGPRRIHLLPVRVLRHGLPGLNADVPLHTALSLASRTPAPIVDLMSDPQTPGSVVVDGALIVGWVPPSSGDGMRGASGAPDSGAAPPPPTSGSAPETGRFRAFTRLAAPETAASGTPMTIRAGFSSDAPASDSHDGPVLIPGAPPRVTFEIQLSGFGFTFPSGATAALTVTRDKPEETVTIEAVPDEVTAPFLRCIEATYNLDGVPVGRAWCDVLITPAGAAVPPAAVPTTTSASPASGGTELGPIGVAAPDLTVTIKTTQGDPEITWQFQTPYAVARPASPVTTRLTAASAQAFSTQLIAQLPRRLDDPLLDDEIRGLGGQVADEMPVEFWTVLQAVLAEVPADRAPTLLLVLDEPCVPWELALLPDQLAPEGCEVPLLGRLCSIGRWLVSRRTRLGEERPVMPPPDAMTVPTMAVVVGDYETSALRLKGALAECDELIERFGALRVGITADEISDLVANRLQKDGAPYAPALVHFALHGQVSSTQQQFVGLKVGAKGEGLLRPSTVREAELTGTNEPFVFLNACQVGAAMTTLGTMGGLVSSFVIGGARGVIGPLWDVDDGLAKELSSGFYTDVLERAVPVGEAVRRVRDQFGSTAVHTSTPLAYVFYGHPGLVLDRAAATPVSPNGADS